MWWQIVTVNGWMDVIHVQSWQHLSKIVLLAVTFLLSVVLNNMALRYIPVSFVEVMASWHSMHIPILLAYWVSIHTHISLGRLSSHAFTGNPVNG